MGPFICCTLGRENYLRVIICFVLFLLYARERGLFVGPFMSCTLEREGCLSVILVLLVYAREKALLMGTALVMSSR